jgi:protocatechuate 3,4-dioxygenase alpha subunit
MKLVPTASQTVGPFFGIGLGYLCEGSATQEGRVVSVHGRVLDAERGPVPDAVLELWRANSQGHYGGRATADGSGRAAGFARIATDDSGSFRFCTCLPGAVPFDDASMQAPHIVVLVFARGLMRHLITRMYFPGQPANGSDAILQTIPEERRGTLIAQSQSPSYDELEWDVVLQGTGETVFFAW